MKINPNLTVIEVIHARVAAQDAILAVLQEFQRKTGLLVTDLDLMPQERTVDGVPVGPQRVWVIVERL